MKEWFAHWFDSPYYHRLYKNRDEHEALVFVNNIVQYLGLNDQHTLLDLACGKGRHALAFAAHGLDVTGVDLSPNSINDAATLANDRLHFYVHDMRQIFRSNYYDVVCNLFTSFGYFEHRHDNLLAAKAMWVALKPNGILVVDFVNRAHARRNIEAKPLEEIQDEDISFHITRSYSEEKFTKEITVVDQGNEHHFQESLSSFSLSEMTALFISVGFTFKTVFGNYKLDAYDENQSPRMILIFEK